ncbi:creatininase family protein [Billgrantia kenyensis]|uniref:Creatininase family protein n=1 Tax=Billgrantia kenyensis TaxID=321266 RepID=A0A7V9VZ26_9GAMM|nr:creatininase family protein [Halomonas kenyensis]MBA2778064.1 creatininase family protein [Halomonas kenyensis]MCG6661157.1 creatininase family protein [Halomonas kenyensis]
MESYLLTEMTWPEVEAALKTVKLAIVPVGAHEQHGPHMNESCDAVLATEMAKHLAQRLHPLVLVTPTVNMGVSPHHLNFPGTISLRPETLLAVLRDMVVSLKRHGIDKVLFLNSHGGNQGTLGLACASFAQELEVDCYYAKTTASAKQAMKAHISSTLFGHSCEREVSEAYYLAPHLVRPERLVKGDIVHGGRWEGMRPGNPIQGFYRYEEMTRNGCIGDATQGSYEIGKAIVEEALDELGAAVRALLSDSTDPQPARERELAG